MSERSRSRHGVLFADACLLSAAAFCAVTAVVGSVIQLTQQGDWPVALQAVGSLTTLGAVLFGPLASLLLHRVRIGWLGPAGMLAGLAAAGALGMLLPVLVGLVEAAGIGLAALIALVAVASAAFLALTAALCVSAWRDLRSARPENRRLDRFRLVCAALVVLFAAAIGVIMWFIPGSEIGEAPAFGLAFAFVGGMMALGASLLVSFRRPSPGAAAPLATGEDGSRAS